MFAGTHRWIRRSGCSSSALLVASAFPPNESEIDHRAPEVVPAQFRAWLVVPGGQPQFVEPVAPQRLTGSDGQAQVAGDQLDVEDPAAAERRGKQRTGGRGDPHHLRTTLGVVHGTIE